MLRAVIEDIAYFLPEQVVTNQELSVEHPDWDMDLVTKRSGVLKRHRSAATETSLDLALQACRLLFNKNTTLKIQIDALIFCTQSQDYPMPPNACVLHKMLELEEEVLAFDFNLACSGYTYGLAIANGLIAAGTAKNILLVTADTYSKFTSEQDRAVRVLFGDGAAVSWIAATEAPRGIIDIQCATCGKHYDKFIVPAGGARQPKSDSTSLPQTDDSGNIRTLEDIHMDGMGIFMFVNSKVPAQIKSILSRNELRMENIDFFVFHQASKLVLDSLQKLLRIPPEKTHSNLADIGNTVSASIPILLKDLMDSGKIKHGNKILLCGFGVGLSWGTVILEM